MTTFSSISSTIAVCGGNQWQKELGHRYALAFLITDSGVEGHAPIETVILATISRNDGSEAIVGAESDLSVLLQPNR
jgi:hypothetical protein